MKGTSIIFISLIVTGIIFIAPVLAEKQENSKQVNQETNSEIPDQVEAQLKTLRKALGPNAGEERFNTRNAASALGKMGADAIQAVPEICDIYQKMLDLCLAQENKNTGSDRWTRQRIIQSLGAICKDSENEEITNKALDTIQFAKENDPLNTLPAEADKAIEILTKQLEVTLSTDLERPNASPTETNDANDAQFSERKQFAQRLLARAKIEYNNGQYVSAKRSLAILMSHYDEPDSKEIKEGQKLLLLTNAKIDEMKALRKDCSKWQRIVGWDIKKGNPETNTVMRTKLFRTQGPWRINYRSRPNSKFKVTVYKYGQDQPFNVPINKTGQDIVGDTIYIEDGGTFWVVIDAQTFWWWLSIEKQVPDKVLEKVVNQVRNGEVYSYDTFTGARGAKWINMDNLSKNELTALRGNLEELYDTDSRNIPAGGTGARIMFRKLNEKIGPNSDPEVAFQMRIYSIFPEEVHADWVDDKGKNHTCDIKIENSKEYAGFITSQVQDWSDKLFKISGGKFAIYHKTGTRKTPFTHFEKKGSTFWIPKNEIIKNLPQEAKNATLLIFWMPVDSPNFPPRGANAYVTSVKTPWGNTVRCVVVFTAKKRLKTPGGWTGLTGGLPHEFWHLTEGYLKEAGFKGFIPSNHKDEDGKAMRKEVRLAGTPPPEYQYEDYYANIPSWRTCKILKNKYGWVQWGNGPTVENK